ncbi:MAG: prolipoprotein diacylglyceryl transferase [Bacteroidales bacterium]|nr:prolipoprotein diacylglyceryl transferase [Bacteroidales bacterium]
MILQSIVWDVDPWLIKFSDSFGIRWYGLLFASVFLFGYIIFNRFFKRQGFSTELLDKLTIYIAVGTIIGARLGHCFFYDAAYFLENPMEILMVWKGGLASHGGAIGILVALWLYVRKTKISFLWLIDRISVVAALGGFFIRMGNLMNSEIYGRPTDLPWGFSFIRDRSRINFYDSETGELLGKHLPCHPTQLYEGLSYLLIFIVLFWLIRKYGSKLKEGVIFSWFLITVFFARFLIEYVKFEQSEFEINMISNFNMNMGQLLSIPFILMGIALLIWIGKKGKYTEKVKAGK